MYRYGKARAGQALVHGALTKGARDTAKGQKIQVYIQTTESGVVKSTPDWSQRSIHL